MFCMAENKLKYADILRMNREYGAALASQPPYQITILSNIITSQLNEVLEYTLRMEEIHALVSSGDYDTIVQDSLQCDGKNLVVIFWELANIVDGFQYKAEIMDTETIDALKAKVQGEIDLVFANLRTVPLVVFNTFSTLIFSKDGLRLSVLERFAADINAYLRKHAPTNVLIIDVNKILSAVSVQRSVDARYYYSSKALYTIDFYKEYARFLSPVVRSMQGKAKKALIFDCDNTLWKGIIGEDGITGIEMSGKTSSGAIFEEVQYLALALQKRGVIMGLCSKNNIEDVEEVLLNHPDMVLTNDDFAIKKINWEDKATNLQAIAKELNIGLDSIVFVDDSDFEVNFVREQLPQITILQVPKKLHEYPWYMRETASLFFTLTESKEDSDRSSMYRQEQERVAHKSSFGSIDEYLASLGLVMRVYVDDTTHTARIAQLTQKTNQFNLTTKRYTGADIQGFIENSGYHVYAFEVSDKFGDYGLTGVSIVHLNAQIDQEQWRTEIDSFLMSCRVLGRKIEWVFLEYILHHLSSYNITNVYAEYHKTPKNSQVQNFYDQAQFTLLEQQHNDKKCYTLAITKYQFSQFDFIKAYHGRQN